MFELLFGSVPVAELALLAGFIWGVVKLVRVGYVNKLGPVGRWAVYMLVSSVAGYIIGRLHVLPDDNPASDWIAIGLSFLCAAIAMPWIKEGAKTAGSQDVSRAVSSQAQE